MVDRFSCAVLSAGEKKAICDFTDQLESSRHAPAQSGSDSKYQILKGLELPGECAGAKLERARYLGSGTRRSRTASLPPTTRRELWPSESQAIFFRRIQRS